MIPPMQNFEVKVRCRDLSAARAAAEAMGAAYHCVMAQRDVFFDAPGGRLKLRRTGGSRPQLVGYSREDSPHARSCTYHLLKLSQEQADALETLLALVLPRGPVVCKRRELFMWRSVRIHLDTVEGLGEFVEFEDEGETEEQRGRELIAGLMRQLGLREEDIVPVAYADLLREKE